MTILSFTSAVKYIFSLMLAMLGYIPFESLEIESPQKEVKEINVQKVTFAQDSLFKVDNDDLFFTDGNDPRFHYAYFLIEETVDSTVVISIQQVSPDSIVRFEFGTHYFSDQYPDMIVNRE